MRPRAGSRPEPEELSASKTPLSVTAIAAPLRASGPRRLSPESCAELCSGLVCCPPAPGQLVGSGAPRVTPASPTTRTGRRGQRPLHPPRPARSPFPECHPEASSSWPPSSEGGGSCGRSLEGWFVEQTTPLPGCDGSGPFRLAKCFSQDWAFLSYWHRRL